MASDAPDPLPLNDPAEPPPGAPPIGERLLGNRGQESPVAGARGSCGSDTSPERQRRDSSDTSPERQRGDQASPTPPAPRFKVRLRFHKDGDLRFVSHHDLMRCFERMLRRAGLPYRTTEGFHPKPRVVFALSLPLGVVGRDEVVEIEFTEDLPPGEVRDRLAAQAPPGLEILSAQSVPPRATAQVRRLGYRVALPPGDAARAASLAARAAELLAAPSLPVERTRPRPRRADLRPFLDALRVTDDALEMDLLLTPDGTARPEEVLRLLGLNDLLDAGCVLERRRLELTDEATAGGAPACQHSGDPAAAPDAALPPPAGRTDGPPVTPAPNHA